MCSSDLAQSPEHGVLLNNVAWLLLTERGDAARALPLIHRAVWSLGPDRAVLDTKGLILLASDRPADAIRALETLRPDGEETAVDWLHLAAACRAAGRGKDADFALQQARSKGLKDLSPYDQRLLESAAGR